MAVGPACGGSGGPGTNTSPPLPTILFADDFSALNVNNWAGTATYDGTHGNPAPSLMVSALSGTSDLQFSFVNGLTVSFDCICNGVNGTDQYFAGLADPGGATGQGSGFILKNDSASVYFNNTFPAGSLALSAGWHSFKMSILPSTHFVQWYVDGTLRYTSTSAINIPSPQSVMFATNTSSMNADNVVVTTP
jgi:hypothetical protein